MAKRKTSKAKVDRFYSPEHINFIIQLTTGILLDDKVYPVIERVLGEAQARTKYVIGLRKYGTATHYPEFSFKCDCPSMYSSGGNWFTVESFVRYADNAHILDAKYLNRRKRLQQVFPDLIELYKIFVRTPSLPDGTIRSKKVQPRADDGTVDPIDYVENG